MVDRKYIFKGFLFNFYVSLPQYTSTCDPLKKEKNKNTLPPKTEEELVVSRSPSIQKSPGSMEDRYFLADLTIGPISFHQPFM